VHKICYTLGNPG